MLVKDLLKSLQDFVEKDPSNLEVLVICQHRCDKYTEAYSTLPGHIDSHFDFVVEEFYKDTEVWMKEMGYDEDYDSFEEYIKSDDTMQKVFAVTTNL